ncbi:DUF2155 domain-containing protein [Brevundimonas vitis]|uniref:DUF2155 domain-containing protein n=1 Tax=Brevundimonas vitisensis TaxID=2800818 RepID=A0ABX7BNN8_9CAUL|nr:DUF2155 domain-containing protein [Brevundimonas vitisensis]QQQ19189.1 DUF2155 domain-containing protein [Brevundimonas vitisensis]
MKRRGILLTSALVLTLAGSGVVIAAGLQDSPQDARPSQDPIADLLRQTPAQPAPAATPAPSEAAPAGTPAPAAPIPVTPPGAEAALDEAEAEEAEVEEAVPVTTAAAATESDSPASRPRRRVAIVQAIDKVTAESMRFEVEVGGRPVRFDQSLIFTARACEVSAPDERGQDAFAYLQISLQPRGTVQPIDARQIFQGWMFASSPGLNALEHPVYDAWVVGCKG